MNEAVASELAELAAQGQRIRQPDDGNRFSHPLTVEEAMEFARVDVTNTDRLREIIASHGWPGRNLVGNAGAEHAWVIAQHADRQLGFQREALRLLAAAVAAGDAPAHHLAYLTDRVRVNEGRPQLYGTQIAAVEAGRPVPWPIENPSELDTRRDAMGLEPWAEYAIAWESMK